MKGLLRTLEAYINPSEKPEPLPLTWDVSLEEQHRIIWAYANLCNITYHQAMEQLYYLSYSEAKEFLGES
jgi:hypothetical protein